MSFAFHVTSLALVGAVVLSGCGGGDDSNDTVKQGETAVNTCRATAPSVSHGFYGCITTHKDVGVHSIAPLANLPVNLYPESAAAPTSASGSPLASANSNGNGFYELAAEAGSYWLCTDFFSCTPVTLGAGEKKRKDYESGTPMGFF